MALPSGANNTKGSKVKQSDSKKLRELRVKHKGMQDGVVKLALELSDLEEENENLQKKVKKLQTILIEQRGVIVYLEYKLKGMKHDAN